MNKGEKRHRVLVVDDLHGILGEGSLAERRAFIKSFIREVKVTGKEALLTYTTPILPDTVSIKGGKVLPTVQYGGRYWTRTSDLLRVKQAC